MSLESVAGSLQPAHFWGRPANALFCCVSLTLGLSDPSSQLDSGYTSSPGLFQERFCPASHNWISSSHWRCRSDCHIMVLSARLVHCSCFFLLWKQEGLDGEELWDHVSIPLSTELLVSTCVDSISYLDAQIIFSLVRGSSFSLVSDCFLLEHVSVILWARSCTKRCCRLLYFFFPSTFSKALVPFSGYWYLEAKIWELGVLTAGACVPTHSQWTS